jgi:hypothetical protein
MQWLPPAPRLPPCLLNCGCTRQSLMPAEGASCCHAGAHCCLWLARDSAPQQHSFGPPAAASTLHQLLPGGRGRAHLLPLLTDQQVPVGMQHTCRVCVAVLRAVAARARAAMACGVRLPPAQQLHSACATARGCQRDWLQCLQCVPMAIVEVRGASHKLAPHCTAKSRMIGIHANLLHAKQHRLPSSSCLARIVSALRIAMILFC